MILLCSSLISPSCCSSLLHSSVSPTSLLPSHVPRPLDFLFFEGLLQLCWAGGFRSQPEGNSRRVGQQRPSVEPWDGPREALTSRVCLVVVAVPELLGPAMRNTSLSLRPTWDTGQEVIAAWSWLSWSVAASHQGCLDW